MNAFKYPRTHHLPWSAAIASDDRILNSDSYFLGHEVVVTEKMDGECTTLLPNRIHARSIDSPMTAWREPVKTLWSRFAHTIPDGFRICGENVVAEHSIRYTSLPSCFLVFSVWENDVCMSWDDSQEFTRMICEDAGLSSDTLTWVPVLYRGVYDRNTIHSSWTRVDQTRSLIYSKGNHNENHLPFPRLLRFSQCIRSRYDSDMDS